MITLTEKAVQEIRRIHLGSESTDEASLRVMVVGGGCSGMSYKLDFEKDPPKEKDKVINFEGVRLLVDPKSYLFLDGTELDFSDGLNGKGFVFSNPNAKRTCGCGNSFST